MKSKVKFKLLNGEHKKAGDVCTYKYYAIHFGGVVVGYIDCTIRDLFQSHINPGYSVTVIITWASQHKSFRRYSNAFSNRSMKEARENRAKYINEAKQFAMSVLEPKA